MLASVTAVFVLAVVAVAVVPARAAGGGEEPGGPAVRVGKIRADTVIIDATSQRGVPGAGRPPEPATAPRQPLDEVTDPLQVTNTRFRSRNARVQVNPHLALAPAFGKRAA